MSMQVRIRSTNRPAALPAFALVLVASISNVAAQDVALKEPGDQENVECRLPPQIRTLGRNATYLAGGRSIQITVAECKVRGGTFNGQGPGSLAGRGSDDWVARSPVPVIVGGDASQAGCPRSGSVTGAGKGGLAVRSGPSTAAKRIDSLPNGRSVVMCDWSVNGDWVGVVYANADNLDCGLSKYIATAQPYSGACRSGWVSSKYVR
jgi:hypothetical protein